MGFGQRLTRAGEGGHVEDSRALCLYTRHWQTHSNTFIHSHTLTRPCTHTGACFCPPPHQTCAGISEGSPIFSPVLGVRAVHLLRAEPPPPPALQPRQGPEKSLEVLRDSRSQLEADLRKQRSSGLWTNRSNREFLLQVKFSL